MSHVHARRACAGAALFLLCCAPGVLGRLVRRPLHPRSELSSRAVAGGAAVVGRVRMCECERMYCVCERAHTRSWCLTRAPLCCGVI